MTIEHTKTALLVIDVQQELFQKSTPIYQAEQLLQNITNLIDRAHDAGVPVIYVQHSSDHYLVKGSPGWQLHPQLQPENRDFVIHKLKANAFEGTNLDELLKNRGITHLVVSGLVTHSCVKATCLGALKLGYQVTLVSDAHSNFSGQAADVIEKCNNQLTKKGAILKHTASVDFI